MPSFLDRLRGRPSPMPTAKATYGDGWLNAYQQGGIPLEAYGADWQGRAARYLAAYRVGWFYKAGSRISRDFANLPWTLAYEDVEGDNAEEIVAPANNVPFEQLEPLEQFLRLSERPNPYESGRQFKQRQQIRLDFTGRALVYLEGGDMGLPTAFYGINPCRMWKSYDNAGHLIGWVMDKDAPSGGVPFSTDEIVAIEYPGADEDPVGAVESVYSHVPLTQATARHVADVLATGGRLAGMAWPKERSLSEDEFQDAQRAWRSVTSDPNAARRLLLFPEPMEYTAGAASPSEIGIPELANLTRDEVLTAFPIAPEMLMVPMATGLNSGQTQAAVEARYWSGTMHPRVEVWEDAFQQKVIPLYEQIVGRPLDFDIDEPDLDDAPSIIEKVGAYKGLVSVGFDPKEAVTAVGLDGIKWLGLPDLLDPAKQAAAAAAATEAMASAPKQGDGMTVQAGDTSRRDQSTTTQVVTGKALTRDDVMARDSATVRSAIASFLDEQRARIIGKIETTMPESKAARMKADPGWWDAEEEDRLLRERMRTVYLTVGREALQVAAENTGRILSGKAADKVLDDLLRRSGLRITDINETTRKTIAETLETGVRRGYSIPQLVNGVPGEAFGGVHGALMANGVNVWDTYRAEVIARTETMTAYNESALLGYKELAVTQVEALDGDKDDECASRHGQVFPVDEALGIQDHPNGTLDWAPITKAMDVLDAVVITPEMGAEAINAAYIKAFETIETMAGSFAKAVESVALRPQSDVHVHNSPPGVTVEAPITVSVPEQAAPVVNVAAAEAPLITVNVPEQAPATVTVNTAEQPAPVVNVSNVMPEPFITVEAPVIPAPIVNVSVPDQAAPVVNVTNQVQPSKVTVKSEPVTVNLPSELRITSMPDRVTKRVVERDETGLITETQELETDG